MAPEEANQATDMKKVVMISVAAAVITLVLGAAIAFLIRASQYSTFTDDYYKIKIKYQNGWIVHKDLGGTIVTFISPKDDELDRFSENLNITVSDLPADMTLEKFSKIASMQTEAVFAGNLEVVKSEPFVFNGMDAYNYEVKGTELPALYLRFVWFFKDNKAYVITYVIDQLQYEKYRGKLDYMLNSFSFGEK